MPTSSQAMILRNIESKYHIPLSSYRAGSASCFTKPAEVNNVDINELFDKACASDDVKYLEAFMHGNENEIRTKMSKILKLKGFKSVLSYNPLIDSFQWKFYKETADRVRPKTGCLVRRSEDDNGELYRPKSAAVVMHGKQVSFTDDVKAASEYKLPENIRSLGFRDPFREKEARAKPSATLFKKNVSEIEDKSETLVTSTNIEDSEVVENNEPDIDLLKRSTGANLDVEDSSALPKTWDTSKYEDRCYPATHTLKIPPEKRPLVVCFSLPENEKYSHKEVKDMLVNEFNCDITKLQFDPLSVRAGDTVVRNRWLVEVSSKLEADHMVRAGFRLDDVQIVIKFLDEITSREHQTYLYLEKIRSEKRDLKLPFSMKKAKSAPKIMKTVKVN
ncbi:uncharacterized protein [Mytilus edulis]|uniref:uncharacterized protein n=1 Tax=Mytilus edulis TaxID=6550 RepID=UPI0039EF0083